MALFGPNGMNTRKSDYVGFVTYFLWYQGKTPARLIGARLPVQYTAMQWLLASEVE